MRVIPRARLLAVFTVLLLAVLVAPATFADPGGDFPLYEVSITNLTRSQIFSPPVVVTHTDQMHLFVPGQPASAALALLAEEGMTGPLLTAAMASPEVLDAVAFGGMIHPGQTASETVAAGGRFSYVSAVGMLVSTNDTFFALSGAPLPPGHHPAMHAVIAWDAGSELNSENCAYVPGPPCGAHVHDPATAEGYVYVGNGISGIAGLAADVYDWNNPVARIVVRRLGYSAADDATTAAPLAAP